MAYALRRETRPSDEVLTDVVELLWQTKRRSVAFIERWLSEASDSEVAAGLGAQLIDERRHYRLLGEQVLRLGRHLTSTPGPEPLMRIFVELDAMRSDLHRLCGFHRSVKAFSIDRVSHLLPIVDIRLAAVFEPVAHEDERHIRWADIRLERLLSRDDMRECNLLMSRMRRSLEAVWEKHWQQLSRSSALGR